MPRPKKPPRVRMQIVFERDAAKRLRAFAKARDNDISQVVRVAVSNHIMRMESKDLLDAATILCKPQ